MMGALSQVIKYANCIKPKRSRKRNRKVWKKISDLDVIDIEVYDIKHLKRLMSKKKLDLMIGLLRVAMSMLKVLINCHHFQFKYHCLFINVSILCILIVQSKFLHQNIIFSQSQIRCLNQITSHRLCPIYDKALRVWTVCLILYSWQHNSFILMSIYDFQILPRYSSYIYCWIEKIDSSKILQVL